MFGFFYQLFTGRDPRWPALRRLHLALEPCCQVCESEEEPEVHHVEPVHCYPEKELDRDNLITLCRIHHLWWGHLGDWLAWNPSVIADAEIWRSKIRRRKTCAEGH